MNRICFMIGSKTIRFGLFFVCLWCVNDNVSIRFKRKCQNIETETLSLKHTICSIFFSCREMRWHFINNHWATHRAIECYCPMHCNIHITHTGIEKAGKVFFSLYPLSFRPEPSLFFCVCFFHFVVVAVIDHTLFIQFFVSVSAFLLYCPRSRFGS